MNLRILNSLKFYFLSQDPKCSEIWYEIETKLSRLFRKSAEICFNKGLIQEDQRTRYFVSGN